MKRNKILFTIFFAFISELAYAGSRDALMVYSNASGTLKLTYEIVESPSSSSVALRQRRLLVYQERWNISRTLSWSQLLGEVESGYPPAPLTVVSSSQWNGQFLFVLGGGASFYYGVVPPLAEALKQHGSIAPMEYQISGIDPREYGIIAKKEPHIEALWRDFLKKQAEPFVEVDLKKALALQLKGPSPAIRNIPEGMSIELVRESLPVLIPFRFRSATFSTNLNRLNLVFADEYGCTSRWEYFDDKLWRRVELKVKQSMNQRPKLPTK